MQTAKNVLRIDASMRREGSVTRRLTDRVLDRLAGSETTLVTRDLAYGMPLVDEGWIVANFADDAERTEAQRQTLAISDALVAELKAADTVVIGLPIYNFGVPAALKAWVDQVTRARVTFRYTDTGPVGLLEGKRAVLVIASGGVGADSPVDFATPYMRHLLGFIGITDVTVIAADRHMMRADAETAAEQAIREIAA
ncbi:MAG: NAD(P)H-dependent oxidoreductase [Pseudomonadota bacterium]